jgi:hypothetical protein
MADILSFPSATASPAEIEQDMKIAKLNQRYALVGVCNRMAVAEFDQETKQLTELWPQTEFKLRLMKQLVAVDVAGGGTKLKPLAPFWLSSPKGKQYDRLVSAPPGSFEKASPSDFNLWQGFAVDATAGDWSKNKDHIKNIICDGREELFAWVMNWLALMVQKPGLIPRSSLVLIGGQGAGKGHFVQMLGSLFHPQQFLHLIGGTQLTGTFNGHLSGKVLVFADEAVWAGNRAAQDKLKGLITEAVIPIERKFLDAISEPSSLHVIIATNSDFPMLMERDDRRFCILKVSNAQQNNEVYFAGLRKELDNDGREALLHELLHYPVNEALVRQPPLTAEKVELKNRSLSREEQWLQNWLLDVNPHKAERVQRGHLYVSYSEWSAKHFKYAPLSKDNLGRFLSKLFGTAGYEKRQWPKPTREVEGNGYQFPPLAEFRAAFDRATGTMTDWPEVPDDPHAMEKVLALLAT